MAGRGLVGGIIGGEELFSYATPVSRGSSWMAGSDILLFEEGMPH